MEHKNKDSDRQYKYTMLVIPAVVMNGMLSGIISVITAYFFRPIWHQATKTINALFKNNKDYE